MNTGSTKAEKGSARTGNTEGRTFRKRTEFEGTGANGQEKRYQGNSDRNNGERGGFRKNNNERGKFGGNREGSRDNNYYKGSKDGARDGSRPYRPRFEKDMDDDEDNYRRTKQSERRSQKPQSQMAKENAKIKEQQPDKMDVVKRLEKEKKAMQKKSQNSNKNKANAGRMQRPVKRSNNIDWTREYENDSYDDDDMSFY